MTDDGMPPDARGLHHGMARGRGRGKCLGKQGVPGWGMYIRRRHPASARSRARILHIYFILRFSIDSRLSDGARGLGLLEYTVFWGQADPLDQSFRDISTSPVPCEASAAATRAAATDKVTDTPTRIRYLSGSTSRPAGPGHRPQDKLSRLERRLESSADQLHSI
ncbi:unnamed protein product [Diplocarpon coronariae]